MSRLEPLKQIQNTLKLQGLDLYQVFFPNILLILEQVYLLKVHELVNYLDQSRMKKHLTRPLKRTYQ